MLGHDDVCPQVDGEFAARRFHFLDEPLPSAISGQELVSAITREGQFAGLPRLIESLAALLNVALAGSEIRNSHELDP
jgi:hypothetical protein